MLLTEITKGMQSDLETAPILLWPTSACFIKNFQSDKLLLEMLFYLLWNHFDRSYVSFDWSTSIHSVMKNKNGVSDMFVYLQIVRIYTGFWKE